MSAETNAILDEISQCLHCNFDTGEMRWLIIPPNFFDTETKYKIWRSKISGKPAFNIDGGNGYLQGRYKGRMFKAHRVIWAIHSGTWPEFEIDHINRIRDDNRISNLRPVTRPENMLNKSMYKSNTSGVCGVSKSGRNGKWVAYINVDGRRFNLGEFDKFPDAVSARRDAELKHFNL